MHILVRTFYKMETPCNNTFQIAKWMRDGKEVSVTLDEASFRKCRKFLNINIHRNEEFVSLGMLPVDGSLTSAELIAMVTTR